MLRRRIFVGQKYGNVLESASIVYPRLNVDSSLPMSTQQSQNRTLISFSENKYTNDRNNIKAGL